MKAHLRHKQRGKQIKMHLSKRAKFVCRHETRRPKVGDWLVPSNKGRVWRWSPMLMIRSVYVILFHSPTELFELRRWLALSIWFGYSICDSASIYVIWLQYMWFSFSMCDSLSKDVANQVKPKQRFLMLFPRRLFEVKWYGEFFCKPFYIFCCGVFFPEILL